MALTLRPYQERDLAAVRQAMRTHRSVLLVQPTGAGKGTLASFIVTSAAAKGNSTLFMVQRRTLVHDMSRRLDKLGIDHGIIMGSNPRRKPWLHTHVASIDTLHRREQLPKAALIIVDEAHSAVSPTFRKVLDRYPAARVLLMTATPIRLDSRGLCEVADFMVQGPSVADLISQGYLVPSRVFSFPVPPDTSGIRITAGDFNQKSQAAVFNKPKLVGDIVQHWKLHASERKTVSFGIDQKHAQDIAERFRCAGIECAYVDAETSDDERDKIWNDLDYGTLRIVSSVNTVSYGWDHKVVSCIIQGRATLSLGLDLQQLGRGSRPCSGKLDFLVLDHVGNTHRHGFYEDERQWSLAGGVIKSSADASFSVCTCRACFGTFRPGPLTCPYCGAAILKRERTIEVEDGQLEEIRREQKATAIAAWQARQDDETKRAEFEKLRRTGIERGYKDGWAKITFKVRYGSWPPRAWCKGDNAPDYADPTWVAGEQALRAAIASRERKTA